MSHIQFIVEQLHLKWSCISIQFYCTKLCNNQTPNRDWRTLNVRQTHISRKQYFVCISDAHRLKLNHLKCKEVFLNSIKWS
jgi:hypothetical protein